MSTEPQESSLAHIYEGEHDDPQQEVRDALEDHNTDDKETAHDWSNHANAALRPAAGQ